MTEFDKNNYIVIKQALEPEIAQFVFNYFLLKRQVAKTFFETRYISPIMTEHGVFGDGQIPNSYAHYGDIAMETLLLKTHPIMEKQTGMKLIPTYSYARIYGKGDVLERHTDRYSCEISTTMYLGGDSWPIYLEPSGEIGKEGIKISLAQGDMLVYRGDTCEHWRESFEGEDCAQVFLHYTNALSENAEENVFDGRPHVGLPNWFKSKYDCNIPDLTQLYSRNYG
jgi:hypothetical protein